MIAALAKGKTLMRPKRTLMTLIAAFRTNEGVAICADSQETVGDYRVTVKKIAPISVAGYQMVVAGSGDADPIEGVIELIRRRFITETEPPSADRALQVLEEELSSFYTNDLHSGESMKLFIAICCPSTKEYKVWVSHKHVLAELEDFALIGWDEPLYKVSASRMYRKNMNLMQACLAAIHVLVIGEESSNYIKGPFTLAVIRESGIWIEEEEFVETLRSRLKKFEEYTNQILLACSDTTIYPSDLHNAIQGFAVTAQKIHEDQINEAVAKMSRRGLMDSDPLCKVPLGLLVEVDKDGNARARHDVNGIEEMSKKVNEALARERESEEGVEA